MEVDNTVWILRVMSCSAQGMSNNIANVIARKRRSDRKIGEVEKSRIINLYRTEDA